MQDGCLIVDWIFTVLVTVFVMGVYVVPRKRLHPMFVATIAWVFFCWSLQFFFLEYGMSTLEASGHPETITLLILVMAVGAVGVLWCFFFIAEFLIVTLTVMIVAQTTQYVISLPVAAGIGLIVWLILDYTPVANLKHAFTVALFTSVDIGFGLGSIILETSVAIDTLSQDCQSHFNMALTCDANCGSLLVYANTNARVGWVIFVALLFVIKFLMIAVFTSSFHEKPKLKGVFLCCDLVQHNADRWIRLDDRKTVRFRHDDPDEEVRRLV